MCSLCGLSPDVGPVIRHASSFFGADFQMTPTVDQIRSGFVFGAGKK